MSTSFQIGFWHPFGPHAGETSGEIIERKLREIQRNGWTLWSFSYKKPETLCLWVNEIEKIEPEKVLVFCSDGKGAKEPKSATKRCDYYLSAGESEPIMIPPAITIPHPMGTKSKASAFIVEKIIYPADYEAVSLDWFYIGQNKWQDRRSSTFGEHLIRPGQGKPIGQFIAILELRSPFVAEVGVNLDISLIS